jgi:hypothetical protein
MKLIPTRDSTSSSNGVLTRMVQGGKRGGISLEEFLWNKTDRVLNSLSLDSGYIMNSFPVATNIYFSASFASLSRSSLTVL